MTRLIARALSVHAPCAACSGHRTEEHPEMQIQPYQITTKGFLLQEVFLFCRVRFLRGFLPAFFLHCRRMLFHIFLIEIRPPLFRSFQRLFKSPCIHLCVIARKQDFRHFSAVPLLRPLILRIFEQPVLKRLGTRAFIIPEHAGHKP